MSFSALIGNAQARDTLEKIVASGNLPSTLLFHGPEGVGKTAFAHQFATAALGRENHPDLLETHPEGKLHSMKVLKELIHEASLPPFEAERRIFIIHDAHCMLPAHSNALLKTLEEPHLRAHFILLTSEINAILPTIRSRAIEVPFFPIPAGEIAEHLGGENAGKLALLAEGSLGRAARLRQELPYDEVLNLIKAGMSGKHALFFQAIEALEKEHTITATLVRDILTLIAYWYRDLHLVKRNLSRHLLIFQEEEGALEALSKLPLASLEEIEALLAKCMEAYKLNFRLRHILERALLT